VVTVTSPTTADDEATPSQQQPARHIGAYIEMLIGSALGLVAAFVLSVDAIELARNPAASFSCDISAKVSCSTVGLSWQASLLGFPNAFLGLMTEPVVITLAVAALAGVRFPRWFMLAAQAVYSIGFVFAFWLFYQAYFNIGALCPWCMLVTATTTLVFVSMTRINILDNNLGLPDRIHERLSGWLRMGADLAFTVILLAIIAGMVIYRYV
jgi:uncharacterized membrane protein